MPVSLILAAVAALALAVGLVLTFRRLRQSESRYQQLFQAHAKLRGRFSGIVDADEEKARVLAELARQRAEHTEVMERAQVDHRSVLDAMTLSQQTAEEELAQLQARIEALRAEFNALDEEANLQSFGLYRPRYALSSSEQYQAELERIRGLQKEMVSDKTAAVCGIEWTVNGSRTEGRKQINQSLKLILRAFNGECDAAVARVKYNNVGVMQARIRKAWEVINSLVQVQQCSISTRYLELKLQELQLAHEYEEKLQEEKEEQRRIREQMREEEIALREIAKAQQDAEKEERRYADALQKARTEVEKAAGEKQSRLLSQIEELEARLAEAQANKERAIARAQLTRSGHVYVISNIGSFGEHVYKIGMTRRLEPLDRVRELGDASVPFQFDVHAMIWTEDAPGLENAFHRAFHHRRVNRVNERKEFFNVTIDEIAHFVHDQQAEIELTRVAEAAEYHKTMAILADLEPEKRSHPVRSFPHLRLYEPPAGTLLTTEQSTVPVEAA